jgi:hypothetical protein
MCSLFFISEKPFFSLSLIYVQVITKNCRLYMARNKLLNDLLTTIHLYINKIRHFLEVLFLAYSFKHSTLLKLVR